MFAGNIELYHFLYWANIIVFALYGYDKHCAHFNKWRIPEAVLLACGVAASAFGALCGMIIFKHKISKPFFYIGIPLLLFVQVLGLVYYLTLY